MILVRLALRRDRGSIGTVIGYSLHDLNILFYYKNQSQIPKKLLYGNLLVQFACIMARVGCCVSSLGPRVLNHCDGILSSKLFQSTKCRSGSILQTSSRSISVSETKFQYFFGYSSRDFIYNPCKDDHV